MTSVKISKTTLKAVAVLEKLNELGEACNADIADALKLPRATCYRLLETLCVAGMVQKDKDNHSYRPAERVLSLSCGFEQETWISVAAKPHMDALGSQLLWPIAIATLAGTSMLLRETTDRDSPLVVRRFLRGRRVDVLATATGRVYLAHCTAKQRRVLLKILEQSGHLQGRAGPDLDTLARRLESIREVGFDTSRLQSGSVTWGAIAVPVFAHGQILASLSLRYIEKTVSKARQRDEILPALRHTTKLIGESFESRAPRGRS